RPQLFQLVIDQKVSIQSQGQFIRFEYQGDMRGQQSFLGAIMNLLNNPNLNNPEIFLKLSFEFPEAVMLTSPAYQHIVNQLSGNPVERLSLMAKVTY
ncbi:MAG: hypothetical protein ACKO5Q_25265, partial [Microcystaceae cyanobacterium]